MDLTLTHFQPFHERTNLVVILRYQPFCYLQQLSPILASEPLRCSDAKIDKT